jgi:hypothetical protein
MRIRRGIIAAGVMIGSIGVSFATAGAASAATPTTPVVFGIIVGPHSFILKPGEVVVVGETLHPDAPAYDVNVPVTGIRTNARSGATIVSTGRTFLPLNRIGEVTAFTVVPPVP